MTSIARPVSVADVKRLDMSPIKPVAIWESDEMYGRIMEAQEALLEMSHSVRPDTSRNPAYAAYATVQVGGKVVAEIDNHGWVTTSNALGGRLGHLPDAAQGVFSGPALARARAEYLAEQLGGEVVMSSTALTQAAFQRVPQPKIEVDVAAMQADPLYQNLQQLKQARARYLEQRALGSSFESTV
jgi:hypothetical protein